MYLHLHLADLLYGLASQREIVRKKGLNILLQATEISNISTCIMLLLKGRLNYIPQHHSNYSVVEGCNAIIALSTLH